MQRSSFRIDMLGTSFSIAANESPEYLEKISKIVKEKSDEVRESTGLHDSLKIAIITGIVLCDELERLKRGESPEGAESSSTDIAKSRAEQDLAENLALELIERLDIVLKEIESEEKNNDCDDEKEEEDCESYNFDDEEEEYNFDKENDEDDI